MATTSKKPARPRRPLGDVLTSSLREEERHVQDKFAAADRMFGTAAHAPAPSASQPETLAAAAPVEPASTPQEETVAAHEPAPVEELRKKDTFSFPAHEWQRIIDIKEEARENAVTTHKSEIVRAGLVALMNLSLSERLDLLRSMDKPKPGPKPRT